LAYGTQPDPHYTLYYEGYLSGTGTLSAGPLTTYTTTQSDPNFPAGSWLGDDTLSTWIGPTGAAGTSSPLEGQEGLFDFYTTFTVSGLTGPGTVTITGQWTADNWGTNIFINGVQATGTGLTTPQNSFGSWTPFTIQGTVNNGMNTLEFQEWNQWASGDEPTPTGLRVEFTSASVIPEPSTWVMVSLGLSALFVLRRRRS
jgi:hypothetical protein